MALSFAGGIGVAVYLVGWVLTLDSVDDRSDSEDEHRPRADSQRQLALALILLGVLLGLRAIGLWFGDPVVWTVTLVSFGLAVSWDRGGGSDPKWLARLTRSEADGRPEPSRGRIALGALLMVGGLIVLFGSIEAVTDLGVAIVAVLVTAAGFMLVFGPWVWRLANDLTRERRERIRSEERAEVAAHLHDSVLQTLALIQRSDDPRRTVTLARAQERELRSWLYGTMPPESEHQLSTALEAAAAKVEDDHDTPVDVVTVADCPVDERVRAIVQAATEAMANAARHSGADRITVYAEVEGTQVDVWVSDQGSGFDLHSVPDDRGGIADSIVGRMGRNGGTAQISSDSIDGTEVHLTIEQEATA